MDYIDIIMPAYNCEEYIENAINTVKKQTYKNWNLIIVNDYSTDGTKKKILENVNEKIQLIDLKSHVGVAEARNVGIKKSKNRYIAFLDADDMWKENKLYEQLKFMKQNEYEFTFTSFSYLKNGKIKRVKRIPSKLNYNQALKNTIILTSTVMIDQAKVKNIKMPKIESEDTALNLASMSIIKEEIVPITEVGIHILLKLNNYKEILKKEFDLEEYDNDYLDECFIKIAKSKSIAIRKDDIDYEKISLYILNMIKQEKITNITFDRFKN